MPDFTPRMPQNVEVVADIATVFSEARKAVVGGIEPLPDAPPDQRYVVIITPGRMLMQQPCPLAGSLPPEMVAGLEQILPSKPPLNITVIGLNDVPALLSDISQTIPFFGYLLGLCYVGHNVLVFEGHPTAYKAAMADTELVIADDAMLPFLQPDWAEVALNSPRSPRVLVFTRDGVIHEMVKKDE